MLARVRLFVKIDVVFFFFSSFYRKTMHTRTDIPLIFPTGKLIHYQMLARRFDSRAYNNNNYKYLFEQSDWPSFTPFIVRICR